MSMRRQKPSSNAERPKKRPRSSRPAPGQHPRGPQDVPAQIRALAHANWRNQARLESKAPSDTVSPVTASIHCKYIQVPDPNIALQYLDEHQYLQLHLWPEFRAVSAASREADETWNSSSWHALVFSVIAMFNHRQLNHPGGASDILDAFDQDGGAVSSLIDALFRLNVKELHCSERGTRLSFLIFLFRALDHESVRQSLLPLLSLPVWVHLSEDACKVQLENFPYLLKPLSKLRRRAQKKSKTSLAKLSESALFSIVTEMEEEVVAAVLEPSESLMSVICTTVALLIELLSQIRLRRTILPLLADRGTLPLLQSMTMELEDRQAAHSFDNWFNWNRVLELFTFFMMYPLHPVTGQRLTPDAIRTERSSRLLNLQRACHTATQRHSLNAVHSLRTIAMGTHCEIGEANVLRTAFLECSKDLIYEVFDSIKLTTARRVIDASFESVSSDRQDIGNKYHSIMAGMLASYCRIREDVLERFRAAPLMITEQGLWGSYGASEEKLPEALPVLNLEFLDTHDYLLRNFTLYKWESAWAVRQDLQDVLERMEPSFESGLVKFSGWAKKAAPVTEVSLAGIGHRKLDAASPSRVAVEVKVDLSGTPVHARHEWHGLRQHELLFLLKVQKPLEGTSEVVGTGNADDSSMICSSCQVRGFVVAQAEDRNDAGRQALIQSKSSISSTRLSLMGSVDSLQYFYDTDSGEPREGNPFSGYNLIVRRCNRTNNFHPLLSLLHDQLLLQRSMFPGWLEGIVLGRSTELPGPKSVRIVDCVEDMLDTFVDEDHIRLLFPVAETVFNNIQERRTSQRLPVFHKMKLTSAVGTVQKLEVTLYSREEDIGMVLRSMPSWASRRNKLRFTEEQIEGIRTAGRSGITLIAGPPGTGKTSCVVQILSNLYHTKPRERILLITRTNHALNDLVSKLLSRNVDPLKILRLGQGESEMKTEETCSKTEQIDALLQRRLELLELVETLYKSLEDLPAPESVWSCESAREFYQSIVQARWEMFADNEGQGWAKFPFRLFVDQIGERKILEGGGDTRVFTVLEHIRQDCSRGYNLVSRIFENLESLRFLEVLKTEKERGNYLVAYYSRITAMTAVHASVKRQELLSQCFSYDTLIIEQAAEILEVEAFACFVLQATERLKRIVLLGDHKQPSPVVHYKALQQRANFGQSLFARLVRLGHKVVNLAQQGRSRPSIVNLFRWRYPGLKDMDCIRENPSFGRANPGFLHTAQFIDTGDVSSETQSRPDFYQNVAEAEYIAFTFLYMRMLGYPCYSIAVLTACNGQTQLIKEVVEARSSQYGNLGMPHVISTLDSFQGHQSDYVLLSLVRTRDIGRFRDRQRITLATSRARLGLYMFGYLSLFETCADFEPVLLQLHGKKKLALVAGETFSKVHRKETTTADSSGAPIREVHSPADMASIVSYLRSAGGL